MRILEGRLFQLFQFIFLWARPIYFPVLRTRRTRNFQNWKKNQNQNEHTGYDRMRNRHYQRVCFIKRIRFFLLFYRFLEALFLLPREDRKSIPTEAKHRDRMFQRSWMDSLFNLYFFFIPASDPNFLAKIFVKREIKLLWPCHLFSQFCLFLFSQICFVFVSFRKLP